MATHANSTPMSARRGFLRGLASLPLVGGGVALLGQPTAAAVPVTDALLERYHAWLSYEHREALVEIERRRAQSYAATWATEGRHYPDFVAGRVEHVRACPAMYYFPDLPDIKASTMDGRVAHRAAVVLSAAGVAWA